MSIYVDLVAEVFFLKSINKGKKRGGMGLDPGLCPVRYDGTIRGLSQNALGRAVEEDVGCLADRD